MDAALKKQSDQVPSTLDAMLANEGLLEIIPALNMYIIIPVEKSYCYWVGGNIQSNMSQIGYSFMVLFAIFC